MTPVSCTGWGWPLESGGPGTGSLGCDITHPPPHLKGSGNTLLAEDGLSELLITLLRIAHGRIRHCVVTGLRGPRPNASSPSKSPQPLPRPPGPRRLAVEESQTREAQIPLRFRDLRLVGRWGRGVVTASYYRKKANKEPAPCLSNNGGHAPTDPTQAPAQRSCVWTLPRDAVSPPCLLRWNPYTFQHLLHGNFRAGTTRHRRGSDGVPSHPMGWFDQGLRGDPDVARASWTHGSRTGQVMRGTWAPREGELVPDPQGGGGVCVPE